MNQTSAPAGEADQHASFIKTPKQLIVVVLLGFLVPIFGIALILQIVVGRPHAEPAALTAEAVSARLQPVGKVEVVDANAPRTFRTGEEIVKTACAVCHASGVAGAPKTGDNAEWGKRGKAGLDALVQSAIKGKGAMPPRGGLPDLLDLELARAIVNLANQSGLNLKEPAASADGTIAPAAAARSDARKRK